MRLYFKRKVSAAHRLAKVECTQEVNKELFGNCSSLHGHEWLIEIWLEGDVRAVNGMVLNFNELKKIVDTLDHKFINDFIALPTAENMVSWILQSIREVGSFSKITVRVWETDNGYAEDMWEEV